MKHFKFRKFHSSDSTRLENILGRNSEITERNSSLFFSARHEIFPRINDENTGASDRFPRPRNRPFQVAHPRSFSRPTTHFSETSQSDCARDRETLQPASDGRENVEDALLEIIRSVVDRDNAMGGAPTVPPDAPPWRGDTLPLPPEEHLPLPRSQAIVPHSKNFWVRVKSAFLRFFGAASFR